jgi:hypothetical protein
MADVDPVPSDATLRPDHGYFCTTRVDGNKGETDSLSGDEVPLHSIRVQKDFKQVEG